MSKTRIGKNLMVKVVTRICEDADWAFLDLSLNPNGMCFALFCAAIASAENHGRLSDLLNFIQKMWVDLVAESQRQD